MFASITFCYAVFVVAVAVVVVHSMLLLLAAAALLGINLRTHLRPGDIIWAYH